ncbi:MAG: alpha/beta fold hydrolase [Gemmatimonadetes bacterium]|nr:alpha/beta fold hydrolase [Gemmatimonadota bacterium]
MTAGPPEPARRRRWLPWSYLVLLVASHGFRLASPATIPAETDERTRTVRAVAGDREGTDPVRIAYREDTPADFAATRPVIVLLHGSPGDNDEVRGLGRILGTRYRVLAPDLPGFGGSSRDVPDYSNRAHARYLLQLLDSLGVPAAHLVGFSMGGGVALQVEALAPDRVRSLTLLSAIGAQEYELLGDYHLNHLIHGVQLAGLWLLREGVPHFGWLDDGMLSVPYARNFYDTDQRPYRGILSRYAGPMLILHGARDVLVSPAAAREHARLVPQAELRIDDGDHFTTFTRPEAVADPIGRFVAAVEAGTAVTRAAAPADRLAAAARPFDPRSLPRIEGLALGIVFLLLAVATLISEDLTCITAGLMIARGTLGFWTGTLACFTGIFLGDLLVFQAGRTFGRAVLARAPVRWFITPEAIAWSSQWIERRGAALVFLTRVLPGTRLPTYFAAGMLRTRMATFALYFFVACAIWTPIIVGVSVAFGEAVQRALAVFREHAALYLLVTALVLFVLLKLLIPLVTWRGRRLLLARWRRLTRWEFWPRWMFYPPVALYILWLALRHRSLLLFTAVNPAIPGGGFVGESKSAILRGLAGSPERVAPWTLVPAALPAPGRVAAARAFQATLPAPWPLVLKPDIGERGSGVAITRSEGEVEAYLARATGDTIAQAFAPGAEFGVFYVRHPGEPAGRIFSITEKRLPTLTGDGVTPLEELILRDERALCMAPFHFRRHAARLTWVPAAGEVVPLVELGTHCRGAVFLDGGWVETPALAAAIDGLSQGYAGFWFGRYDIRTPDVAAFQRGEDFQVVELNGATAEATSIYDPANALGTAYRTLFAQWRLLFAIAAANVARGARPASLRELWALLRGHARALRGHAA